MRYTRFSIASILSPLLSIVALGLYAVLFETTNAAIIYVLWIISSIGACILPIFAKRIRTKNWKSGKVFEIIGLAIGALDIAIVSMITLFPLTNLSGLIGWAIAITVCVIYTKTSNSIVPSAHPQKPISTTQASQPNYKKFFMIFATTSGALAAVTIVLICCLCTQGAKIDSLNRQLTQAEAEANRKYDKGYSRGETAGYDSGRADGIALGEEKGFEHGYSEGYMDASRKHATAFIYSVIRDKFYELYEDSRTYTEFCEWLKEKQP